MNSAAAAVKRVPRSQGYNWEGGNKVPGFIHYAGKISGTVAGSTYSGLFHVTDWLPTIIGGFLARPDLVPDVVDGFNQARRTAERAAMRLI